MTEDVRLERNEMSRDEQERIMGDHAQELYLSWADDHDLVNDLIGSAEDVGERPIEPEDTLSLACSAAIASTALGNALDQEWSLYTPQDVAVVAAALQDQLRATVRNLERLKAAAGRVAMRGDMDLPAVSGFVAPADENAADALDRLGGIADELEQHIGGLGPAVLTLEAVSSRFVPAVNSHDNLRAVVALVGGTVNIVGDSPVVEDHDGERCVCTAVIERADDTYYLSFEELGWQLLRRSEGAEYSDGTRSWTNGGSIDLNVLNGQAHPRHIASEVKRALGE